MQSIGLGIIFEGLKIENMKNTPKRILYAIMGLCFPVLANAQTCTYSTTISTVAGSHVSGYTGDGAAGSAATMKSPWGVVGDGSGNLYFADYFNHAVRMVDHTTGIITTVAGDGTGVGGFSGDSGPATAAKLNGPAGINIFGGSLYIADKFNERIRAVNLTTGIITTIAGNGLHGGFTAPYGDNGPASAAALTYPIGVTFDCFNHMYITDIGSQSIRRVNLATDSISLFAGTHGGGYNGDGIAATAAKLNNPSGLTVDCASGDVYISDSWNNRVRKVSASTGLISTYAGTGDSLTYSGDGGAATAAKLWIPWGITLDPCGNLYICDYNNNAVRVVDGGTGNISTYAGGNGRGYDGDGDEAAAAKVYLPSALAIDGLDNVYVADYGNMVIRFMGTHPYASRAYVHGTTQHLEVNENDAAVLINSLMAVPATTGTQTWTISAGAEHGSLSGFPATSTATTGNAVPTGITYKPNAGYSGDDQFTIVMNDGVTKASTTVNVKVNPSITAVVNTNGTGTARGVVSPNPNNGTFKCEFVSTTNCQLRLVASDVTGRVIYTQTVNAVPGVNSVSINLPSNVQRPALIMVSLGNGDVKYPIVKMVVTE